MGKRPRRGQRQFRRFLLLVVSVLRQREGRTLLKLDLVIRNDIRPLVEDVETARCGTDVEGAVSQGGRERVARSV